MYVSTYTHSYRRTYIRTHVPTYARTENRKTICPLHHPMRGHTNMLSIGSEFVLFRVHPFNKHGAFNLITVVIIRNITQFCYHLRILFKQRHDQKILLRCAPTKRLRVRQVFNVSTKKLHLMLFKLHQMKLLIRLCKCAGWSESTLGAHARMYVFWYWGSFIFNCMGSMICHKWIYSTANATTIFT